MTAFATVDDYTQRYGEPADSDRISVLLEDASALMLSAFEDVYGDYAEGTCSAFDRSAKAVCCLLVNRVVATNADMIGATQYSQSASIYSASITYGSALGEMYLGKSDLKRLGLSGATRRILKPIEQVDE